MKFRAPVTLTISDHSRDVPELRDEQTFALLRPASFGTRTVPAGTEVELPEAEANAIIARFGQYRPPVTPQPEGAPRVIRPFAERTETRF
jgi:hypothetical protein